MTRLVTPLNFQVFNCQNTCNSSSPFQEWDASTKTLTIIVATILYKDGGNKIQYEAPNFACHSVA